MTHRQSRSGKTCRRRNHGKSCSLLTWMAATTFAGCSGGVATEPGSDGPDDEVSVVGDRSPATAPSTNASTPVGTPSGLEGEGSGNAPTVPNGQTEFDPAEGDDELSEQDPDVFERAQQFFPGSGDFPEKRLFRLTVDQLQQTAQQIISGVELPELGRTMPEDPLETNYAYADNLSVNGANFPPYTAWVEEVAGAASKVRGAVIDCTDSDTECLRTESEHWVRRALRNVVSDAQLARFVDFFVDSVTEVGMEAAVRDLIDVTLTSPSFVFRDEASTGSDGVLLPAQRLQQLTYTLTDLPPEALGFELGAEDEVFASEASIELAAARVLESDAARNKLVRFVMAWLEIDAAEDFTLAPTVFPEFTAEVATALVSELQAWVSEGLATPTKSLKSITTGDVPTPSAALEALYSGDQRGERFGVFTHPAFIASHSGPESTRLVKRGVFFVRKVLCVEMQPPPAEIDTKIPHTPDVTERERVEVATSVAQCSGCHSYINPFGFMLEHYDALGRYRTHDEAGLLIDASVNIDFLTDVRVEADSAAAALPSIVNSDAFQQCFARQLFRYYVGRSETSGDDPILRQMWFAFVSREQSLVEILEQLGASKLLHNRKL